MFSTLKKLTFYYYFRDRKQLAKKRDPSAIVKSNVVNKVLSRSTFSRDSLARLFSRTMLERGARQQRNKNVHLVRVSISRLSVVQPAPRFRLVATAHSSENCTFQIEEAPTRSRSPLSLCFFFRCLRAPLRTGNTPSKDNYNKSSLAQYLGEHCGGSKVDRAWPDVWP